MWGTINMTENKELKLRTSYVLLHVNMFKCIKYLYYIYQNKYFVKPNGKHWFRQF